MLSEMAMKPIRTEVDPDISVFFADPDPAVLKDVDPDRIQIRV